MSDQPRTAAHARTRPTNGRRGVAAPVVTVAVGSVIGVTILLFVTSGSASPRRSMRSRVSRRSQTPAMQAATC